jgi:hypothetical protein
MPASIPGGRLVPGGCSTGIAAISSHKKTHHGQTTIVGGYRHGFRMETRCITGHSCAIAPFVFQFIAGKG